MNVFVTYENNFIGHVTGVYANKRMAEDAAVKKGFSDVVGVFELKGAKGGGMFEYSITTDCKHYTPHMETVRILISSLYELEGCACGGIAHVVLDDDNFDDSTIKFVLDECSKEENQDLEEVGLAKLIMEELLKLSIQQRALLYSGYYAPPMCDLNCDQCSIEHGKLYEEE
jgi:hypothetical protein